MNSQKVKIRRQSKKLQIQGAQIPSNEEYLSYAAVTRNAAQRRSWTFYEAVKFEFKKKSLYLTRQYITRVLILGFGFIGLKAAKLFAGSSLYYIRLHPFFHLTRHSPSSYCSLIKHCLLNQVLHPLFSATLIQRSRPGKFFL